MFHGGRPAHGVASLWGTPVRENEEENRCVNKLSHLQARRFWASCCVYATMGKMVRGKFGPWDCCIQFEVVS